MNETLCGAWVHVGKPGVDDPQFIRGQKEGTGCLNYLVCRFSINLTAMYEAGNGIWRCSAAFSFSIILFFSLPATTIALNISYSPPTQCSPFQITWDDSPTSFRLAVLPLNARPVRMSVSGYMRNDQTRTFAYTISPLTLKTGTQFVFILDYGYCAPFISSLAMYEFSAHTIPFSGLRSPNSCG